MKKLIIIAILSICSTCGYAQRNNNNGRAVTPKQQTTTASGNKSKAQQDAARRQAEAKRQEQARQDQLRKEQEEQERLEAEKRNALRWDDTQKALCYNGQTYPMVLVKGGTYTMGENYDNGYIFGDNRRFYGEKSSGSSQLVHTTLDSYYIGKYEVTQDLWEKVMGNNPSFVKGDRKPVTHVNIQDCQKFLSKLNSLTGQIFRIPTEEQWEFAARGGVKSQGYKYSGSNSLNAVGWYSENSGDPNYGIHDVGLKNPNELGIYDMSGNVCEWCASIYGYADLGNNTGGIDYNAVVRGGDFHRSSGYCTTTKRDKQAGNFSSIIYGLRIVLVEE